MSKPVSMFISQQKVFSSVQWEFDSWGLSKFIVLHQVPLLRTSVMKHNTKLWSLQASADVSDNFTSYISKMATEIPVTTCLKDGVPSEGIARIAFAHSTPPSYQGRTLSQKFPIHYCSHTLISHWLKLSHVSTNTPFTGKEYWDNHSLSLGLPDTWAALNIY